MNEVRDIQDRIVNGRRVRIGKGSCEFCDRADRLSLTDTPLGPHWLCLSCIKDQLRAGIEATLRD